MPFTNADWLPSYEDLSVPEIELTAAPLRAASHHLGKYCDYQCKEYMLCRQEEKDPRKCINEGKEVTRCGMEFFQMLKKTCAEEYTKYWECLDHAGQDMAFHHCRPTQSAYDKCMLDKFGQERPDPGYFAKMRVHKTNRPRPQLDLPMPEPTPEPPNPADVPIPDSYKEHGHRAFFLPK